ncbi:hypothetical protein F2Q68_00005271 [Brassica cretica]|uniref:Uncharacterized protein n=1 Tax=Brassica cretica TaxID=69181 RepID=A0A8S9JI65_BRACR|nr:hypothetical protein F2Q68_00005271 [Brassica cretica]
MIILAVDFKIPVFDPIVQPPAMKLSLKIRGTCTQPYQHTRIENMMHPSPSPSQNLSFTMKKLSGLDRLIWTQTKPPLASGQFFGLPGGVSSRTSTDLNP